MPHLTPVCTGDTWHRGWQSTCLAQQREGRGSLLPTHVRLVPGRQPTPAAAVFLPLAWLITDTVLAPGQIGLSGELERRGCST